MRWGWLGGWYGGGGAEGGEGGLVDLGGDLDPLGVLEAGEGVDGVDAEGAVGVAGGLVAAGDEGGLELAHGIAAGSDLETEHRARRGDTTGVARQRGGGRLVDHAGGAEPLGRLELLDGGRRADPEDPVDPAGRGDAGGHERLLQRPNGVAPTALAGGR